MTLSGIKIQNHYVKLTSVLIPLLLDDPLWGVDLDGVVAEYRVLIPLLLDDPLWESRTKGVNESSPRLNPSFAG